MASSIVKRNSNDAGRSSSGTNEPKQSSNSPAHVSKKSKVRAPSGPRRAVSAFCLFAAEKRMQLRNEKPNLSFGDISKYMSKQWKELPSSEKQKYLEKSQIQKDKYYKEKEEYQKSDSYRKYLQHKQGLKSKAEADAGKLPLSEYRDDVDASSFELSIFTEDFMKHNQERELEMRQLRKNATELEEQNAVLGSNVEKLNSAIERITQEMVQSQQQQLAMQHYLDLLRASLVQYMGHCPPPVSMAHEMPSMENIDDYMSKVSEALAADPSGNEQLVKLLRNLAARLDYPLGMGI